MRAYAATPHRARFLFGAGVLFAAGTVWAIRHVHSSLSFLEGDTHRFGLVYFLTFLILVYQTTLAYMERPHRVTNRQHSQLDKYYVVANVPVYNEDPEALKACLTSLFTQFRRPQLVFVVDDGSDRADYDEVYTWAMQAAVAADVILRWEWQPNAGKRHAQGRTFADTPQADIYFTVDSDTILDHYALEEGLKPFRRDDVMSVAGVVLSSNSDHNLLTRIVDLWYLVGQMSDRSALSAMGSVLVNSGPLALYRAHVVRECLDGYLNETFFGRKVEFSDDSMLTLYAITRGRTVQQPTAFAFCLMPEKVSHHVRQYVRWMRGSFIRSWWRFRYLPMNGYAFWAHILRWIQMVMGVAVFVALFAIQPFHDASQLPTYVAIPILIGYGQALRYLAVNRSDLSFASQFFTFALAPVAAMWGFFGLRLIRWYAIATCLKTGNWGSRQEIEVRYVNVET